MRRIFRAAICSFAVLLLMVAVAAAQELYGGLQGTVKDSSGAVIKDAQVIVSSPALVGTKEAKTDGNGFFRFANLPAGSYTVNVTAKGFAAVKQENVAIEVGHLGELDLSMKVGSSETVVEVSSQAPLIDLTSTQTISSITPDVVKDVPHGTSFQSVIQFAPMARNEPLMGSSTMSNGTGGGSPGNMSNGNAYGFSVGGAADSENGYLVEGQSTANVQGGFSHTNVPFDFIQEVDVKSSGIESEFGGALGGVVNVLMKRGSNSYHGSIFTQFENSGMDAGLNSFPRYDPSTAGAPVPQPGWGAAGCPGAPSPCYSDGLYQAYQPIRPHTSTVLPGFTFGGPILKDKLFFFVGFNPWLNRYEEFEQYQSGVVPFSQNTNTYYLTSRIDASLGNRVRLYGSWLYQYQKEFGSSLPAADNAQGLYNVVTGCYGFGSNLATCTGNQIDPSVYRHTLGFSAPNHTTNVGADITISPNIVSTTRFGYYFENYHDFGYPTGGVLNSWAVNSVGSNDALGNPLPANLQEGQGFINDASNQNFTFHNANKALQFNQDVSIYKSGWGGTHNFKFGYQMNRLSNFLLQTYNEPFVSLFLGSSAQTGYSPASPTGTTNCAPFVTLYGRCQGQYGYLNVVDFGSGGQAISVNHAIFMQDAWTIKHRLTLNLGLRIEHEYLPGEAPSGFGAPPQPISFGWGSKIAPRIGAAWDVLGNGKFKVFGDYGVFNDVMKLNLAISSFGGQYWQQCAYALDTSNLASIIPAFVGGRDCVGPSASSTANWQGGSTPAGLTFLENQNFRLFPTTCSTCNSAQEGVAPGLKPYRQHESTFGIDYQLSKNTALEVRWDRRRLDSAIEDSAIFNAGLGSETFVIVNPGEGVNKTFPDFWNFLYGAGSYSCPVGPCPPTKIIPAARSYDGVEFRLTKQRSNHWFGMFSYTYSNLRGNYMGLTSSDQADGLAGGRNSPNNSRSFDEPFFSWSANGTSSSGPLPTDRPSTFKGYGYYELPWWGKKMTTDFGLFQYFYEGSPNTSFMDVGYAFAGYTLPSFPVDVVGRGKWIDVSQNATTGAVTVGNPRTFRNPWYTQSDFNITQNVRISESKSLSFSANFTNLFNQHAVTARYENLNSLYNSNQFGMPQNIPIFAGIPFYGAAETPWSISGVLNGLNSVSNFDEGGAVTVPMTVNSQYGQPQYYQNPRTIRLGLKFTF